MWTFEVDEAGAADLLSLQRALIRSRAELGYEQEQQRLDAGAPHPQVALLRGPSDARGQGGCAAHDACAIAGDYAHATAPLRRLVDRFVLATCLAHVEGRELDPALRAALPQVPDLVALPLPSG